MAAACNLDKDALGVIENYEKAMELDQSIQADEVLAVAYCDRGMLNVRIQEYDLAKTDFDKAIAILPDYGEAYFGRGGIYYEQENWQRAIPDFDKAIELDFRADSAYALRGISYRMINNWDSQLQEEII